MLFQIFSLLLQVAVGLVAGTCLLRMYMHLLRINLSASAGNPLAPFVFAITNWLVLPLRRSVPAIGRIDTASLLAAYAVVLAKFVLLGLVMGVVPYWVDLLVMSGLELLKLTVSSLVWLVLIYAMLSWVRAGSDAGYALGQLVEPMLRPLRRARACVAAARAGLPIGAEQISREDRQGPWPSGHGALRREVCSSLAKVVAFFYPKAFKVRTAG
jgi:YggT family protein